MQTAFVFPGQGSQAVGMGKALAEAYAAGEAGFRRGRQRARTKPLQPDVRRAGSRTDPDRQCAAGADGGQPRRRPAFSRRKPGSTSRATRDSSPVIRSANIPRSPRPARSPSKTPRNSCAFAGRRCSAPFPSAKARWRRSSGSTSRKCRRSPRRRRAIFICTARFARPPMTMAAARWSFRERKRRSSGRWSSPRRRAPNGRLPLPVSAPFHCALMQPAAEAMAAALAGVDNQKAQGAAGRQCFGDRDRRSRRDPRQPRRAGDRRGALARERALYGASRASPISSRLGAGKVLSGLIRRIAEGATTHQRRRARRCRSVQGGRARTSLDGRTAQAARHRLIVMRSRFYRKECVSCSI